MNFIVLFPEEFQRPDGVVTLVSPRSEYLLKTFSLEQGTTHPCVLLGLSRGIATVVACRTNEVVLNVEQQTQLPQHPLIAIVAVSRPPTIKRILFQCSMLGLQEIHFIRSEQVEKSYLQSRVFDDTTIRAEMLSGIEQSGSCHLPAVSVHHKFLAFMEMVAERSGNWGAKYLAHTTNNEQPSNFQSSPNTVSAFAVGPEKGWNSFELQSFEANGFKMVSLGARILRVDTAVVYMASRLMAAIPRLVNAV